MFWESKVIKYMELCKDATAQAKIMSSHAFFAFLGQFGFWMDIIRVARWNGLEILILRHK